MAMMYQTPSEVTYHETTGYGIGTEQHDDIEWLVSVNVALKRITVQRGYHGLGVIWGGTFDEFIEADMSSDTVLAMEARGEK